MINFIKYLPKYLFCILLAKPISYILLGLNITGMNHLPKKGPAIIIANHNSHLDGMVLMCLFATKIWPKVRPVGAYDYYFSNKFIRFVSKYILDVVPIDRINSNKHTVFNNCTKALNNNEIIIFFPEGTRGTPEQLSNIHKGIYFLSRERPEVPIVPVFLHGLGKSLPKGEALLVPFFVDIIISESIYNNYDINNKDKLINKIKDFFVANSNKFIKYEL